MVAANAEVLRLRYKPFLADIGRIREKKSLNSRAVIRLRS
jgi:hypothetical protein